ncbi:MAG: ECF transporter S component [Bacteroidales bacterium]|nr:ECF transporter S component [Bacteroidales bacterium]MCM1416332.1 ECF transporter S component [bacterium]MCM1423255.1 ECF transporter S component [bacterium]
MKQTKKLVLAAFFMALGIVLPFLTGQIQQIGNMLLPMHIPILLCGFICGWQYGLAVGLITPILRSILFGMPALMPTAAAMAAELAVYGLVTGLLYKKLPKKTPYLYVSLLCAMIAGRIVWGIVCIPLYGMAGNAFSAQIFLAGAFFNAIPGIILQIVLIPVIMMALVRAGALRDLADDGEKPSA